jgi:Flp pilus assembly protein TadD
MKPTVNQILQQAIASYKEGKIEEAEKSYKKVTELKPDFVEAHYNLGVTLQNLGRLDEAEKS